MGKSYGAPAVERFVAEGGGFELVEVASTSEAVLDYYGLEGRKDEERSGWFTLALAEPGRFEDLPVIATYKGRRTLVVAGERYPLYRERGPVHLEVRVEGGWFS